jgi:DNA-binding MarR family transcriptional regulator
VAQILTTVLSILLTVSLNHEIPIVMSTDIEEHKPSSALEIFTLAAIAKGGFMTFYALLKTGGLQPGGLLPVITRLEKYGFLTRSEEAKRRRRTMELTQKGEAYLEKEWQVCLNFSSDFESILRSVTVALFMGDPLIACDYLHRLALQRETEGTHLDPRLNAPETSPIEFYAAMRATHESRRSAMEADVLNAFAISLEEVINKSNVN